MLQETQPTNVNVEDYRFTSLISNVKELEENNNRLKNSFKSNKNRLNKNCNSLKNQIFSTGQLGQTAPL